MNCKFCEAELPEGVTLCPACGKENEETLIAEEISADNLTVEEISAEEEILETEELTEEELTEAALADGEASEEEQTEEAEPKKKSWKIAVAVVSVVVALAILAGAVLYGTGAFNKTVSYTVSDEKAVKESLTVVATVGDMELTNSGLQLYFWQSANDFYSNYGSYLDPSILDFNKPLDQQIYDEATGTTWQQYFLDAALSSWSRYAALCMKAAEDGFALNAEMQANLDSIPSQLEAMAQSYGYETAEDMLAEDMGAGCDLVGYIEYVRTNMIAAQYLDACYASVVPTMDEIEVYYKENEAALNEKGIVNDGSKTVDARHILIKPKGGTEGADGKTTYSDAEWEACRAEAQKILDQWKTEGATEELFAQYAATYTEDPGSMSAGGLYSDIYKGQMVEPFETWCFDESRQYGDSGLVQTTYGYHIMFFVDAREVWITNVSDAITYERTLAMVDAAAAKWPLDVNYKKIVMGEVKTEAAE